MYVIAVLLVLGSGFLHSVWNMYTKRSLDKNVFLWYCQLIATVMFMPWALMELDGLAVSRTGQLLLVGSVLLHGVYILLLAATYKIGDLSQVYPIMRGTSPLLVPVAGVLLLDEWLTVYGWLGVGLIVCGIGLLSEVGLRRSGRRGAGDVPGAAGGGASAPSARSPLRAPLYALAVGVCIASYIVVDKLAVDSGVPAVVLIQATNIGNVVALSWLALRSSCFRSEFRVNWKTMLLGGVIAPGGYLLFLFALSLAPVAQLAPMREIGTVFGTLMGIWVLREKQGPKRVAASAMITLGIIVLGMWG